MSLELSKPNKGLIIGKKIEIDRPAPGVKIETTKFTIGLGSEIQNKPIQLKQPTYNFIINLNKNGNATATFQYISPKGTEWINANNTKFEISKDELIKHGFDPKIEKNEEISADFIKYIHSLVETKKIEIKKEIETVLSQKRLSGGQ